MNPFSVWFVVQFFGLCPSNIELVSVNDQIAKRKMLFGVVFMLFLLFFQGCEAVYSSVSGLKAHLGSCTLVCNFVNYFILNMISEIVRHRREFSLGEQLVVLFSVIF